MWRWVPILFVVFRCHAQFGGFGDLAFSQPPSAAAGSSFDPTNVTSAVLKARYQVDLMGYANAEGITNMFDASTNRLNAIGEATAINTVDASINGRAYAAFTGTGSYVTNFPALSQTNVIFSVCRKGGSVANYYYDSADGAHRHILLEASSTTMTTYAGSAFNFDRPAGWCLIEQQFAGAASYVNTNSTLAASGDAGSQTMGGITIGQRFGLDNGADYDLACLLIYNGPMTDADKASVRTWLTTRYGPF